eukprot:Skav206794  [mRNA]  locus=scaffold1990:90796:92914:- [translate_table: standard]
MKQLTFYYRRFVPSISWVEPLSGPEFGNTLVSLRSATCTSPAFNQPGAVEFTLSADGQNRVQIGPNGEPVRSVCF